MDKIPFANDAIVHILTQWFPFLPELSRQIVTVVWSRSTRFGQASVELLKNDFIRMDTTAVFVGHPIAVAASRSGYWRAEKRLIELGILSKNGNTYALNYDVTAADLFENASANQYFEQMNKAASVRDKVKSVIQNGRAPTYRAEQEGKFVPSRGNTSVASRRNKALPLGATPNIILDNNTDIPERVRAHTRPAREDVVHNRFETIEEAMAAVKAKSASHSAKQRSAGRIQDRVALFEKAWIAACKEKGIIATRFSQTKVVPRLKSQILIPLAEFDINCEEFATFIVRHWIKIKSLYFARYEQYPRQPQINFVLACNSQFFEAFQQGIDRAKVNEDAHEEIAELKAKLAESENEKRRIKDAATRALRKQDEEHRHEVRKLKRRPRKETSSESGAAFRDWDEVHRGKYSK